VPRNIIQTLLLIALPAVASGSDEFTSEQIEFFEAKVRPVLVQHCYDCHSTDAKKLKGGLYVDSRDGLMKGGDSGAAAVAGKPDDSILIDAVKYRSYEMPPDRKLADDDIAVLVRWVEQGLPWPEVTTSAGHSTAETEIDWDEARKSHWAWQPVRRPDVPQSAESGGHPVDAFVTARRDRAGLGTAVPAEEFVLARRIYLDLIGITPTPQQVADFVAAAAKDRDSAVSSLVDRLLASPLYGQRWGRHWLDVARYSDGFGGFLDSSQRNNAWRYRDWVVDAFNTDLPFDRFLQLQIAGDLEPNKHNGIATGFFALGPLFRSDGGDPDSVAQAKGETLDDRVDTLTRGLLGVTASCARCHDHKFDPIPQKDYYSLAGIFNNSGVHDLPLAPNDVVQAFNEHKATVDKLTRELKQLKTTDDAGRKVELQQKLDELKKNAPPAFDQVHALRDTGAADMKVAIRGNLRKEGDVAPRRFLRVVAGAEPTRFTEGSGRKALAAAIVDRNNPLTVRVFVNRIWMHHFGDGIVRTPSNFGTLGERPTHPQLLDWLASEFIAQGWSIKKLHRLIMTSHTYQLSSRHSDANFSADGDNRLLWRMNPRRMDVEAWRDSLLSATRELDTTPNGPPIEDITRSNRRTLYAKVSRNGDFFRSDEFLRRFDFPSVRSTVAKRPRSVVPQQFLFLLNSPFMVDRAKALVMRLERMAEADAERIDEAYQLLFSRPPTEAEMTIGLEFLHSNAPTTAATGPDSVAQVPGPATSRHEVNAISPWTQYAQILLSSNEFMFVR
jgi:Protein of unknown function (DUF1553)/Protein of unknown function (DUF1549)/Planctomycete cytochrome C